MIGLERLPPACHETPEAIRVKLADADAQQVAGRLRHEDLRTAGQCAPEP